MSWARSSSHSVTCEVAYQHKHVFVPRHTDLGPQREDNGEKSALRFVG